MVKIPLARTIYNVVKQITDTFVKRDRSQFSRVVRVEYPRPGIYTLGFVTGLAPAEIQNQLQKKILNIFVPTTPNPTSGFYLMLPEEDVVDLNISVEDAFKLIVSGGMVTHDAPSPQ